MKSLVVEDTTFLYEVGNTHTIVYDITEEVRCLIPNIILADVDTWEEYEDFDITPSIVAEQVKKELFAGKR